MFFSRLVLELLMDEMEEKAKQLTTNPVSISLTHSLHNDGLVVNVYMSANGMVYNQNALIPQNEIVSAKLPQKFLAEEILNAVSKLILKVNDWKANNSDRIPKTEVSNNIAYKSVW